MFSFSLIHVSIEQGASLLWLDNLDNFFGQICWDEFFIKGEQPLISCWVPWRRKAGVPGSSMSGCWR